MITLETQTAFDFYQSISHRLPDAGISETADNASPDATILSSKISHAPNLLSIADQFDVFVFDAFGVLNVGETAVDGAANCIKQLRKMHKQVFVLTNGASVALSAIHQKFLSYGFDFSENEVVSSRLAAELAIVNPSPCWSDRTVWGAITGGRTRPADLPVDAIELNDQAVNYDRVDAFLFLSSWQWTDHRQQLLLRSLEQNPRPLIVANPDVVAPKESGFTLEPGYFVHTIINAFQRNNRELKATFFGKPFPTVYQLVMQRLGPDVARQRIAMLGDTLHTDVLGAKAQGWCSILVTSHGLFRGVDVQPYIQRCGLVPDWIIPSI